MAKPKALGLAMALKVFWHFFSQGFVAPTHHVVKYFQGNLQGRVWHFLQNMLQICWQRWHVQLKVSNWPATGISSEDCTWMDLIQNLLASRFIEQRWTKMKNAWRSILAILLRFLRSYHISVTFCRYTLNSQGKTGHRQDMITISTCQLSGCLSRLAPMEWDRAESCMLCSVQIGVMPGLRGVSMGHTPPYPSLPLYGCGWWFGTIL